MQSGDLFAVGISNGQWIYPIFVSNINSNLFCCGQADPSRNACMSSTKGSTSPSFIQEGSVAFNNTSSSKNSDNLTTTSTSVVTTVAANPTTTMAARSSTTASRREVIIGATTGGCSAVALLVTVGLLWKQNRQKQKLRKDAQVWEGKYLGLMAAQGRHVESDYHSPQQPHGRSPDELDGRLCLPQQLEGWMPNEIEGASIKPEEPKSGESS